MTTTQSIGCATILTCLLCEGQEGGVEGDLGQIAGLPPSPHMLDVDLADLDGPRPLVFGRDAKRIRPCRHGIDLSVNVEVVPAGRGKSDRSSFYARWKHAWLARHDPQDDLLPFLWDLEDGEVDDRFRPAARFNLTRLAHLPDIEFRVPNPPRVITFGGDLLVAAEPLTFLRELRSCFRRYLKASDKN